MRRRPPTPQRARCSCMHVADTPEWHGARNSGAGLTGRGGADHGNPFSHRGNCVHSTLSDTTRAIRRPTMVRRVF